MRKASTFLLTMLLVLSTMGTPVLAAAPQNSQPDKIVMVADVSGSVAKFDAKGYLQEAFTLAIGLAPDQSQAAVLGVTSEIVVETDLLDTTDAASRMELQKAVQSLTYQGNTNLVLGLQKAVEKLNGRGRIILIGDISEGGLIPSTSVTLAELTEQARLLAVQCKQSGITVDMFLTGQAPEDSELAAAIEQIATESGGKILRPESAQELPGSIADLFFSAYPYFIEKQTGMNASENLQSLPVSMPSEHVYRARVYVPSSVGIQASYAGAGLETQKQSTYSLLDLSNPARDGLSLSIARTDEPVMIYLIADYRIRGKSEVNSEVIMPEKKDEAVKQRTTVILDVLDAKSEQSILDSKTADVFSADFTLTTPDGSKQTVKAAPATDGRYEVSFEPNNYGTFQIAAVLSNGTYSLPVVSSYFEVEDIRPVQKKWTLTMTLAAAIGGVILLAGILFALNRRKTANYKGAAQTMERNRFTGRLQVATVIAGGGEREIAPFVFQLDCVRDETKLSLAQLYAASGVSFTFPQGDKIVFLPGPGDSVIVKNNSTCKIISAGREYGMREKAQLHYDQKIYIVFEENENELEIYYRPSRDNSYSSKKLAVSTKA